VLKALKSTPNRHDVTETEAATTTPSTDGISTAAKNCVRCFFIREGLNQRLGGVSRVRASSPKDLDEQKNNVFK
jgi:hypothetical protein